MRTFVFKKNKILESQESKFFNFSILVIHDLDLDLDNLEYWEFPEFSNRINFHRILEFQNFWIFQNFYEKNFQSFQNIEIRILKFSNFF